MAIKRLFRFGVVSASTESHKDWVALARKAEDLGYSTFLLPDHFVNPLAAMPALSIAAEATTTLRIGSFVFDNDFRHPALLAKEAATLDLLSDGRFELGIGAGWHGPEYEQTGMPFDSPGVRVSKLEESVAIIKQFFTGEPVVYAGKYYNMNGLVGMPTSVQRPHPPIFLAGGAKRVLSLAGREADIVGLHLRTYADGSGGDISSTTSDATLEKLNWVRDAAGDHFDDVELNVLISRFALSDNPVQAAEDLAASVNRPGLTAEWLLSSPNALVGTLDSMAEALQQRREQYLISYVVVSEEDMETFAPVVARLSGK